MLLYASSSSSPYSSDSPWPTSTLSLLQFWKRSFTNIPLTELASLPAAIIYLLIMTSLHVFPPSLSLTHGLIRPLQHYVKLLMLFNID